MFQMVGILGRFKFLKTEKRLDKAIILGAKEFAGMSSHYSNLELRGSLLGR
jgi:hypothetical protein